MNTNWPVLASIFAILAVPFGLAIYEDATYDGPTLVDEFSALGELGDWDSDYGLENDDFEEHGDYDEDSNDWNEVGAMGNDFFDEIFFKGTGTEASLGGAFTDLRWQQSEDSVYGSSSLLRGWAEDYEHPEYSQAELELSFEAREEEGLSRIVVNFPDDGTALRIFQSRWGEPDANFNDPEGDKRYFWFNQDLGVRCVLISRPLGGTASVWLTSYRSAEEIMGDLSKSTFGFETKSIVGSKVSSLKAQLGNLLVDNSEYDDVSYIILPNTEFSSDPKAVELYSEKGKVVEMTLSLDFSLAPVKLASLANAMSSKWGSPIKSEYEDDPDHRVFKKNGRFITVVQSPDYGSVAFTVRNGNE